MWAEFKCDTSAVSGKHNKEHLGSIKGREFFD
jgi:hypothetical protein